ncbi:MAG: hypothetical protein IJI44_05950 [Erysipelotrichaceae bacterium]|nr:hypothetical protein [Erysipelotrichaceae bacterium]
MERYQKKYERIVLMKKLCLIPLLSSLILYILSIYMFTHYEEWIISHIRHHSFWVLFITLAGIAYLNLFTRNLKVNLDYCRIDPGAFELNVKYASFGTVLIGIMFIVSIVWNMTLLHRLLS